MRRLSSVAALACLCLLPSQAPAKTRLKDQLRRFETGTVEERIRLAPGLGRSKQRKAVEALLSALDVKRSDPRESVAVVDALGQAGDPLAVERLVGAWDGLHSLMLQTELSAQLQTLRWKLLEAFGRLGGDAVVSVLSESLNDKDPRVVEEAVRGLGRLQVKASVPALQQLAAGAAAGNLTQAVIEALGEIGDQRAASTLEQAVQSHDRFIEVQAAYALARLGRKEMLARLAGQLKNDPGAEKVGLLAAYYLAKLDRAAGLDHLEKLLRRTDGGYAAMAAEALGKSGNPRAVLVLVESSRSGDPALRISAARALGRLGGARALSALRRLQGDPNPGVRSASSSSLEALGELD